MTDAESSKETIIEDAPAAGAAAGSEAAEGSAQGAEAPSPDLSGELAKARAERDDFYNRYLRAVADLDNYRRRVQREKDELRQFAIMDLVENMIPVYEHLSLAVASARTAADVEAVVTGVSMVLDQFRAALSGVGFIEVDPAVGSEFDPHQHESLAHAPSESVPPERIVQVVRKGFSLKGRLIRPASVILSGGPAAPATEPAPGL
jgi:molecular chaperone GrpE